MSTKLTKRLIDSFLYKADDGKRDIRWDSEMKGFGIRIYPSGQKSFVVSYRQNGNKRLYTIGQYGKITLEQAKELAKKRFGEVADGKDPVLTRKAKRKKHEWTLHRAYKDFLKRHFKEDSKHRNEIERAFERDILPALGKKPIDEVTKDDILKILDNILDRGSGTMANRTLAYIRKFFHWCIERDLIKYSPAYGLSKPAKETTRDRILSDYELKEVWEVCGKFKYPFGPLMHFLILTGQRRSEVANMRWEDYDEDEKLWILPREMTKSDRRHEVPLSDKAVQILKSVPKLGDYVFTSTGNRPFENFGRDKAELDLRLQKQRTENEQPSMPSWTIHDLRRTVASGMARLDIPPHIIEKVLNHTSGVISGVAAVYNRHQYTDKMQEALDAWAKDIERILKTQPSKSFVKIPKRLKYGKS